ncbi:hypothetical protein HK405_001008, partial [Cladochytrium tenue]
ATKIGIYVDELRKHINVTDEVREAAVLEFPLVPHAGYTLLTQIARTQITPAAAPLRERSFKSDAVRPASVGDKNHNKTIEPLCPAVGLGSDAVLRTVRILFTHLKDKNNDQLGERLLVGDISPKELVSMKPEFANEPDLAA